MSETLAPPDAALAHAEKNFRPSAVETALYDWWERSGFFKPSDAPGPTFMMVLPPPNVSGDLHLGHALSFGGYEDLMARWHRMKGEATLWLPGSDHAGIISQIVVERELAKENKDRSGLTRDEFLAEMWRWMEHYKPRIYRQLRVLGCSLDWSRTAFTMDPDKQVAVRTHFIRLHRNGHLYRADRIVHWCLTCQTTYSDLEAQHVERTDTLWFVRYPWADAMPPGTPDVVIATTRPETILADVAVAVHPDDERWKPYIGRELLVPVAERRVRIVADAAVDPAFGTGALKVTPGHDQTDFDIGRRHGLPVLTVIDTRGRMTAGAGPLAGLDRDAGRRDVVGRLRASGLLVKEEPIVHAVGVHDRCEAVDEPLVMKQWWMKMDRLAARAVAAVRDGRIAIVPQKFEKTYFHWMENIRDWPIARQIWWGHAIPAWYCRDCDETIVPGEDEPDPTVCPRCKSTDLKHEPDVLDTWFSSALWPHSTLGWPAKTADLARFYPNTVLETGYDIVFFWVARMIMMGLENTGEVPFSTVYMHGMVRSGTEKMSKSKGNVIDPLVLVAEYGADALRFALVNGVSAGADQQLSEGKLTNARNFANKLWHVGRFVLRAIEAHPAALATWRIDRRPDLGIGESERWILSRTEAVVAEATRLLEGHLFGEFVATLQQFVWGELADGYVELAKVSLRDGGERATGAVRTLAYTLDRVLRLLHPSMPFLTDTLALQLWRDHELEQPTPSLVVAPWPVAGPRDLVLEDRFAHVLEVVRAVRNLCQEAGAPPSARVRVLLGKEGADGLRGSESLIGALAQAEVTIGEADGHGRPAAGEGHTPVGSATVVRSVEVRIEVPRDEAADRERLVKELGEAREALAHSRELLGRGGFADKAPPAVVAKETARLKEREERVRLLEAEMERRRA